MLKKIYIAIVFALFLFLPKVSIAQDDTVNLYFFWSKSCPHCTREKTFLEEIAPNYPYLKIHDFEVGTIKTALLLQKIGQDMAINTNGVPIVIIGNSHIIGYLNNETTGKNILSLIEKTAGEGDPNPVGTIINVVENGGSSQSANTNSQESNEEANNDKKIELPQSIKLPVFGEIETKNFSLPLLTFFIALLDGFNPCAMWTLLFLISLLLGMKDKKRMWILGVTFIVTSALVYFLFLSAWLNLFLFLGFVLWIRILIGIAALAAGGYYLKDYITNKAGACKTTGGEKRQKTFEKIKEITKNRQLFFALAGIVFLAVAVNMIELVCSAGLPAIYTNILSLNQLPRWQYYLYLVFYIFIFMIDDLFVFFTAMLTLHAVGIQGKYSRLSRLIGGILIILIGLLLLFKPEWLMFA